MFHALLTPPTVTQAALDRLQGIEKKADAYQRLLSSVYLKRGGYLSIYISSLHTSGIRTVSGLSWYGAFLNTLNKQSTFSFGWAALEISFLVINRQNIAVDMTTMPGKLAEKVALFNRLRVFPGSPWSLSQQYGLPITVTLYGRNVDQLKEGLAAAAQFIQDTGQTVKVSDQFGIITASEHDSLTKWNLLFGTGLEVLSKVSPLFLSAYAKASLQYKELTAYGTVGAAGGPAKLMSPDIYRIVAPILSSNAGMEISPDDVPTFIDAARLNSVIQTILGEGVRWSGQDLLALYKSLPTSRKLAVAKQVAVAAERVGKEASQQKAADEAKERGAPLP